MTHGIKKVVIFLFIFYIILPAQAERQKESCEIAIYKSLNATPYEKSMSNAWYNTLQTYKYHVKFIDENIIYGRYEDYCAIVIPKYEKINESVYSWLKGAYLNNVKFIAEKNAGKYSEIKERDNLFWIGTSYGMNITNIDKINITDKGGFQIYEEGINIKIQKDFIVPGIDTKSGKAAIIKSKDGKTVWFAFSVAELVNKFRDKYYIRENDTSIISTVSDFNEVRYLMQWAVEELTGSQPEYPNNASTILVIMVATEFKLENIDEFLNFLDSENIKVGFHFIPKNLEYKTYLDKAKVIRNKGHSIGIHGSWDHLSMNNKTMEQIDNEFDKSIETFAFNLGSLPTYFIAPEGILPADNNKTRSHPLLRQILYKHDIFMDSSIIFHRSDSLPQIEEDNFITIFGMTPSDLDIYKVNESEKRFELLKQMLDTAIDRKGIFRLGLHTQKLNELKDEIREIVRYAKSKNVSIMSPDEIYFFYDMTKKQRYQYVNNIVKIHYPGTTFNSNKSIQILDDGDWKFWIYEPKTGIYILPQNITSITLKQTVYKQHPVLLNWSNTTVTKATYNPITDKIILQNSRNGSNPCKLKLKNLKSSAIYYIEDNGRSNINLQISRANYRNGILTFTTNCENENTIVIYPIFSYSFLFIFLPPFVLSIIGYTILKNRKGAIIGLIIGIFLSIFLLLY